MWVGLSAAMPDASPHGFMLGIAELSPTYDDPMNEHR